MLKTIFSSHLYVKLVVIFLTTVLPFLTLGQGIGNLATDFKQQRPFLFEVEKNGKISHILGSMHAGIPLSSYPNEVFDLANRSSNIAFEADANEFFKNYADEIAAASLYPNGQTLEQNLSNKAVQKLKEIFGDKSFSKLNLYRPWAVTSEMGGIVSEYLDQKSPGLWDVNFGIDNTLLRNAKQSDKPITYLDDLADKVSALNEDNTAADLEKLLSYPDPIAHLYNCATMAQRFYFTGDRDNFSTYNKSCENERFLNRLVRRTISWIPKIEPLLAAGNAFIVVGADHMNGPNGLEQILVNKGYRVKRILNQNNNSFSNSVKLQNSSNRARQIN